MGYAGMPYPETRGEAMQQTDAEEERYHLRCTITEAKVLRRVVERGPNQDQWQGSSEDACLVRDETIRFLDDFIKRHEDEIGNVP
jgi:hypothetical protein